MRRIRAALTLVVILMLGVSARGVYTPTGNYAYISADASSPGSTIPLNFLGLSAEKGFGGMGAGGLTFGGYFTPTNAPLINLLKVLGPNGRFNINGFACQNHATTTPTSLTEIQNLHGFLQALGNGGTGWTNNLLYCLDAPPAWNAGDVSAAVAEVGLIEGVFGSGVVTYAVSNEPDNIAFTETTFIAAFDAYYAAVIAVYPSAKFEGPELADSASTGAGWIPPFVAAETGKIQFISEHFYAGGGLTTPGLLMQRLLARDGGPPNNNRIIQDPVSAAPYATIQDQNGTVDVAGGVAGLTNAAVSADYYAAMLISLINASWIGLQIHFGCVVGNTYVPFNGDGPGADCNTVLNWYANPEAAGMQLVIPLAGARVLPTVMWGHNNNVTVTSFLTSGGQIGFLVANIDTLNQVTIVIDQQTPWTTATVSTVSGSTPSSLTATINGVAMDPTTGSCVSACPPVVHRNSYIVIPAGSAALITLQ